MVGLFGHTIAPVGGPSGSGFARLRPAADAISRAAWNVSPATSGTITKSAARLSSSSNGSGMIPHICILDPLRHSAPASRTLFRTCSPVPLSDSARRKRVDQWRTRLEGGLTELESCQFSPVRVQSSRADDDALLPWREAHVW